MMQTASCAVVVFLAAVAHGTRVGEGVTPVEKVIQLLEKIKGEVQQEGLEEAKGYDKFACFCKDQADGKQYAISKSEEKIEVLNAKIKQIEAEVVELEAEIVKSREKKGELTKEAAAAAKKREGEREQYVEDEKELADAIDAVKRAIEALENSKAAMVDAKTDTPPSELMVVAQKLTNLAESRFARPGTETAKKLVAFLQAPGQPAAYEYGSNDIISTLKGLMKTFKADKTELDTSEAETKHSYEMEASARDFKIKTLGELIDQNAEMSASKQNEKAGLEKDLDDETGMKKQDETFLDDLTATCEEKAKQWDQRSKMRASELTVVTEAIQMLKSGVQPNYGANKKLTGLLTNRKLDAADDVQQTVPVDKADDAEEADDEEDDASDDDTDTDASFLQLRGDRTSRRQAARKARFAVVQYLSKEAAQLKSITLAAFAAKLKMGKDHFKKVRDLIKDLIVKLEEQAAAEADQKAYCDEEMGAAVSKRDEEIGKMEDETANIDGSESKIANLKEEIETLGNEIAALYKELNEITELRKQEKADNEKTIADAKTGQEAVEGAIEILKEFYEGSKLLQLGFVPEKAGRDGKTVGDLAPDAGFDSDYSGKQEQSKGIIGLLEVILSDFERTIEATEKDEKEAQEEFEKQEKEINTNIDDKKKARKDKESELESEEADLVGYKEALQDAKTALADAKADLDKLKPYCVDTGLDWKARRAQLKKEVDALKQALQILEDWKK